ncbi:MAG: RNA polymerase sigma factor [Rhodocyclaceae bacterium]|jgi:RNA polymerase sigma factor (sigma-70 family)|nr:RNA polymerase sigma factor [Rhodocyclaceae bacterium]
MGDARTDEGLMLQYRDGDAAAFDILYARHRGSVYRFLLHQTGKREVADELFQDVWMRAINARSGYQPTAKFTTWLYRIASNRLTDHYRQQGLRSAHETELDDEESAMPDAQDAQQAPRHEQPPQMMERQQLAHRLVSALEALPLEQRQAFLLAAEGELTVEEIGRACDVGYETAKSRLRYAYQRLRHLLSDLRP